MDHSKSEISSCPLFLISILIFPKPPLISIISRSEFWFEKDPIVIGEKNRIIINNEINLFILSDLPFNFYLDIL